jgi:predicted PurR-regulated permease PerM
MIMPIYDMTYKFAIGLYNWLLGFIISFYMLFNKQKLLSQLIKLRELFVPKRIVPSLMQILHLSHSKVGKFLIAKTIESFVVGVLCFILTLVLRIPYAILISVVVAFTNIIPFLGPFLGAVFGIIIISIADPSKTLVFAISIVILQQLDANVIGPRIIGNSIGLSSLWIMFSVLLGGGLFGILGMILGVPIFSVIYMLFANYVNTKLSYKTKKE